MAKVPVTELQKLKEKKKQGKLTPEEEIRLKQLIDGEPITKADLAEAQRREAERLEEDKAYYKARHGKTTEGEIKEQVDEVRTGHEAGDHVVVETSLDPTTEHPRITKLKEALRPFTMIECHPTRPNEFILFTRGVAITAGDVRTAKKAMKI